MENRPEFICIWLGLSKIGVIIPLINSNLKQESLLHSITVANCNAVIFSESLESGKYNIYTLIYLLKILQFYILYLL